MLLFATQVGARGKDEWGAMFASSMKRSSVGMSKMRVKQGPTGLFCYFWSQELASKAATC